MPPVTLSTCMVVCGCMCMFACVYICMPVYLCVHADVCYPRAPVWMHACVLVVPFLSHHRQGAKYELKTLLLSISAPWPTQPECISTHHHCGNAIIAGLLLNYINHREWDHLQAQSTSKPITIIYSTHSTLASYFHCKSFNLSTMTNIFMPAKYMN